MKNKPTKCTCVENTEIKMTRKLGSCSPPKNNKIIITIITNIIIIIIIISNNNSIKAVNVRIKVTRRRVFVTIVGFGKALSVT